MFSTSNMKVSNKTGKYLRVYIDDKRDRTKIISNEEALDYVFLYYNFASLLFWIFILFMHDVPSLQEKYS